MPEILENADAKLSTRMRCVLDFLWQEWKGLQLQIETLDSELEGIASSDPVCVRWQQIPGVGPLLSTAVVSAIGNGAAFKKGREFAAWLGLIPRQWSTGGKPKLLGISKRGNPYLRKMFIHGARAAVLRFKRDGSTLGKWMSGLETRGARNVVIVATAKQVSPNQLGSLGQWQSISGTVSSNCSFPLDELALRSSVQKVLQKRGRRKTQSNGVPENLWRNKVIHTVAD